MKQKVLPLMNVIFSLSVVEVMREQALATKELSKIKTPLKEAIEDGMPGLTICGGYQFLGKKYITPDGTELEGLGILDFYTESKTNRLTGDIVIESDTFWNYCRF